MKMFIKKEIKGSASAKRFTLGLRKSFYLFSFLFFFRTTYSLRCFPVPLVRLFGYHLNFLQFSLIPSYFLEFLIIISKFSFFTLFLNFPSVVFFSILFFIIIFVFVSFIFLQFVIIPSNLLQFPLFFLASYSFIYFFLLLSNFHQFLPFTSSFF